MMSDTPNIVIYENPYLFPGLQASISMAYSKDNWPATSHENRSDRRIYGAVSNSVSAWTREC